jgi:hypothetical protein
VTSNTRDIEDVAKQRVSMRLHNVRYSGMSASWEVENATQITRSGAATTGTLPTQVAAQNGGSARGYSSIKMPTASLSGAAWAKKRQWERTPDRILIHHGAATATLGHAAVSAI